MASRKRNRLPSRTGPSPMAGKRLPPAVLTDADFARCFQALPRGLSGQMLGVVLALARYAGLRASEIGNLRLADYDAEAGTVRVVNGKNGTYRVVGLPPMVVAVVESWLRERRRAGVKSPWLLCTVRKPHPGRQLHAGNVRHALARLAKRAGVERLHAHGLRHAYATSLHLRDGAPVRAVQQLLGHSNLATTETYLQRIAPADALEWGRSQPTDAISSGGENAA